MLHELLFALRGYPGNIFVDREEGIQVLKGLTFLHPGEVVLLDHLCILGTNYKEFQEFINKYSHGKQEKEDELHGLYLQAFCSGLQDVLNPYCEDLLALEKEILEDPYIPLSHFQHKLDKYQLMFSVLKQLILHIKIQKIHGCCILELLHKYVSSGNPLVNTALKKLLYSCHAVLCKQLISWMLHGLLLDPDKEFFIQKMDKQELTTTLNASKNNCTKEDNKPLDNFKVKAELLPSYIPGHVAEKVLFIGKSVCLFEKKCQDDFSTLPKSIFKNKDDEFAQKLFLLQKQEEFAPSDFESVVDEIRSTAAEHLWQVVVEEVKLLSHLHIIKDFYLLGRGELFFTFIDQANGLLSIPPSSSTEYDVNMAFQLSVRQVLFHDDSLAEKFYVNIQPSTNTGQTEGSKDPFKAKQENGWSCIGLIYEVPWPLHILLTPAILDRYNVIFRFLLSVRHVQMELHQCWAFQMDKKGLGRESISVPIWQLRTHMSFLVDNLQYYLQVDVLESQFSLFVEKVKSVKDFEEIQHAHENFLTSITSQSFLMLEPVYLCLKEILNQCLTLCTLVLQSSSPFGQKELAQLNSIALNFRRQTHLLFRVLSNFYSHHSSPHLAQLLLRIDYNKYFSNCGGQLGGNIQDHP